ncbi:unnamed protein product [Rotaria sp. Silwood2]|nr:unnamed protein product [Rotaria sp. Silwood2]CAF4360033.1 unnamed protein product [Rotaria sp. Silwood2]CAF4462635.1 unnamed protein product [Rotaria sp. Silwood2]CAF4563554.1 unnamed protein product [Rotaria sp. Silwood2]
MANRTTASASSGPRRKLALVLGIGEYEEGRKLPNAENDANDMSLVLEGIGFIVTKKLHLTYTEMRHVLVDFDASIRSTDMVLFYFAGHGTQWENQNYLIPKDNAGIDGADLKKRAINAQDVLNDLSDRDPFVTIFLLDCCRTYHVRNSNSTPRATNTNNPESDGLKAMNAKAGALIAFACAPGTVADDGNGQKNGLFTKHLLRQIVLPNQDIRMILADVTDGVMEESTSKQIPFLSVTLRHRNICLCDQNSGE